MWTFIGIMLRRRACFQSLVSPLCHGILSLRGSGLSERGRDSSPVCHCCGIPRFSPAPFSKVCMVVSPVWPVGDETRLGLCLEARNRVAVQRGSQGRDSSSHPGCRGSDRVYSAREIVSYQPIGAQRPCKSLYDV
ncbi:hypothetical protein FA13DRAFT_721739 [Coprinellus micaceus]|uniref:Uncharacterized protein n=1 Tax=Coprinellus micaceus TaxID=71717 RepID=A0A4Y7TV68_COPMI|nr:hypothetical protein FA13DRAFT_721739 [Coprinellus micaceus]